MSEISSLVHGLGKRLGRNHLTLSTAESCTGGMIGHFLTNEPGSSEWYKGGIVAYSNTLKRDILNVEESVFVSYGAVSSQCVQSMAMGVAALTKSDISAAVSGIAGPGGGTDEKPVGTVFIAWKIKDDVLWEKNVFQGNRLEIKFQAALKAISVLYEKV